MGNYKAFFCQKFVTHSFGKKSKIFKDIRIHITTECKEEIYISRNTKSIKYIYK